MLRLLFGLCLLPHLAGAALQDYSDGAELDLGSCSISYYGQSYTKLYVEFNYNNNFYACFDALASAGGQDCLSVPAVISGGFKADLSPDVSGIEQTIPNFLPSITGLYSCVVQIQIGNSESPTNFFFLDYGTQAVLAVRGFMYVPDGSGPGFFKTFVRQQTDPIISSYYFTSTFISTFKDLTGCRKEGNSYSPGSVYTNSDTCMTENCNSAGIWETPSSTCSPPSVCLGNNICGSFCSVVGPSVIDFSTEHGAVEDFCTYTLLTDGDLTVLGYFRSRRTTDVPFLDKVKVQIGSNDPIHLKQGEVVVGPDGAETTPTLTAVSTTIAGALLSINEDGVTVSYVNSDNVKTTILFDGTLLHIAQSVPSTAAGATSGLCVDALASNKDSSSAAGCDVVVPDPSTNIDCPAVETRCDNIVLPSPCNEADPQGHIDACKHILCHYPDLDHIYCELQHSLARTCGQAPDWKSLTGCAASACLGHVCGDNEFCGVRSTGDEACLCRGTFASEYRAANTYGDSAVCSDAGHSASVTLYTCFLEEIGVDYTGLTLTDPSCTGDHDVNANSVTFSFNDTNTCGSILSAEGNEIVIKNRVTNTPSDVITREDQATFTFSCVYTQPDTQTVALKISDNSITQTLQSGNFTFSLTMTAFSDSALSLAVTQSTPLALNQPLWIQLNATGIDGSKLALVIDSCWATSEASSTSTNRYELMSAGCPVPADVEVISNGVSESAAFTYHVFQFVGSTSDVYLHCQVNLCIQDNGCVPDCSLPMRRRRSVQQYANDSPALITMAWTQ